LESWEWDGFVISGWENFILVRERTGMTFTICVFEEQQLKLEIRRILMLIDNVCKPEGRYLPGLSTSYCPREDTVSFGNLLSKFNCSVKSQSRR